MKVRCFFVFFLHYPSLDLAHLFVARQADVFAQNGDRLLAGMFTRWTTSRQPRRAGSTEVPIERPHVDLSVTGFWASCDTGIVFK